MSVTFFIPAGPDDAPELNMSNSRAGQLLDCLGLLEDDDYLCGSIQTDNAESTLSVAQATVTLNRMAGGDYWVRRLEQFIALVVYARDNEHSEVSWG